MNERIDEYLSRRPDAESPLRMPEGYLDSLEDRIMARIAAEEEPQSRRKARVWTILKPAFTLAAMFALVFGMGYGVLSLTHTLKGGAAGSEVPGYATAEEELIRPASLLNYYQTDGLAEDEELDEETMVNYLATELSFADLAEIYAQSYQK